MEGKETCLEGLLSGTPPSLASEQSLEHVLSYVTLSYTKQSSREISNPANKPSGDLTQIWSCIGTGWDVDGRPVIAEPAVTHSRTEETVTDSV